MASVALSTRHGRRSRSEARPSTAPVNPNPHAPTAVSTRPPHSFPRLHPPKFNIDTHTSYKTSTPRRGSGNLALQARDSVTVRKRTMSGGVISARVARQNARKANASLLPPNSKARDASPSDLDRGRKRSRSPAATPSTRTNSHRNRPSRSRSPSSSSPSQSPPPATPLLPALSGAPSSYHTRTHVPHNSQETTTSAYPPSSSQSSRSSSPSPSRSRILSPLPQSQKPLSSLPHTPTLDLDPDDVNARLRLLVNNSYFLPPAHIKPELSPIYLTPPSSKGTTSPSAFKEFFRVGKKKERKQPEVNGFVSPGGRRGMSPADAPRMISNDADRHYGTLRHDLDLKIPVGPARNRVVVVRETVENLPAPAIRPPYRTSSLPSHNRTRKAAETFIDPTTQYDMPPPTHYPSYNNLRLDAAGLTGNVELDQFAPPGEPWSPTPTSPGSSRGPGGGMDPQERVWRRALLEQAVDLSLSSTASDPGHVSPGLRDESFRGLRVSSEEIPEPVSPRNKKNWWGMKDRAKDAEDFQQRRSTSSSNKEPDVFHITGHDRGTHSLEVPVQIHSAPLPSPKRNLGQSIIPNVHANLEELERQHAQRVNERSAGIPLPPRLNVSPFGPSSASAPVTPFNHHHNPPSTPPLPMTPLRPRPAYRRVDTNLYSNTSREQVAHEFFPGHSTIRKSLSSPLLSDLHEMGVEVEDPMPFANTSRDSVAAPSLVLQDPHGVTSLVPSNTAESLTSGSNYSEDDDRSVFDRILSPHERPFGSQDDDLTSLDRWHRPLSSPDHGEGRPSFDSFGPSRVRSPDECPARASSTFGFRRSNLSVTNPSPLRHQDIDVDISGDPIEHLFLMESQRSVSPGAESEVSSFRGYVSALDHTFNGSAAPSMRPSSPASKSFHSTDTRLATTNSHPDLPHSPEDIDTTAPISFFDSVQHQSYMNEDGVSSDSDVDVDTDVDADADLADGPPDIQSTIEHSEHERYPQTQTLGRKSLNAIRPTPSFAMKFRNASQPQLPLPRGDSGPPLASMFRPSQPYDLLDRKKPLTNTPLSAPSTSSGILSQLKGKSGKGSRPLPGLVPKSPMVLPEASFELLRYPHGSTFSLATGAGAGTGSDAGSAEVGLRGFETQGSFQSSQSAVAASLNQGGPWRQEQDGSTRKLDGMVTQHLQAEKDRLRKIASAAREQRVDRRLL